MKITDEIVEEIYIELREGKSSKWIANQFGISRQSVQLINNGKNHRQKDMQYPIRSVEKTPETYIVDGIEHIKTGAYINIHKEKGTSIACSNADEYTCNLPTH